MGRIFFTTCIILIFLSCSDDSLMPQSEHDALSMLVLKTSAELNELGFTINPEEIGIELKDASSMASLYKEINENSRPGIDSFSLVKAGKKPFFRESDSRLAFYDPNTKTIVFKEGALADLSEGYLAHELVHAFQDQKWGFDSLWQSYQENPSRERYNIINFLIEGHAELSRQAYEQANSQDKNGAFTLGLKLSKVYDNECVVCTSTAQPSNMPYSVGMRFFLHQYKKGNWAQVERNMTHPPTSTEQMLHPNKLSKDEPSLVTLPLWRDEKHGAKRILDDSMGEAFLLNKLLSLSVPSRESFISATGWDGDVAQIYKLHDGKEVLLWRILFDREEDARQLEASVSKIGMPKNVMKMGRVVDWIITESPELLNSLRIFMSKNPMKMPEPNRDDQRTTIENELKARAILGFSSFYPMSSMSIGPRR